MYGNMSVSNVNGGRGSARIPAATTTPYGNASNSMKPVRARQERQTNFKVSKLALLRNHVL